MYPLRYLILCIAISFSTSLIAQIPEAFSFQSLILNDLGLPLANQNVGVKIDIHTQQIDGQIVYSETHQVSTNQAGVYSINIGQGAASGDAFSTIDWLDGLKFISLFHDNDGGTNYTFVGSNQLLSVPYALAAGTANVKPLIYIADNLITIDKTLDPSDNNPKLNIAYLYRWIQGIPEDVYIDYSGLPANTHIESYYDPNIPTSVISTTDTIYGGQIPKVARIVISDQSQVVNPGIYDLELVFRTATTNLDALTYTFEVLDPVNQIECYTDYLGTQILTSTDCEEFDEVENTTSELVLLSQNELSFTNFLGLGEDVSIVVFDQINCQSVVELGGVMINDSTEVHEVMLEFNNGLMEFDIELMIEPSEEGMPPFQKFCKVTYE